MNSTEDKKHHHGLQIRIKGTVQGVGFRPFIAQLAQRFMLVGHVFNDANGVFIQVWGPIERLDNFLNTIEKSPPLLAVIDEIQCEQLDSEPTTEDFTIHPSQSGLSNTHVAADAGLCDDCLTELMEPSDRRYHYPFINCTHCGPRFSIIKSLPYDRDSTSMSSFSMCSECQQEYQNPLKRRYHAQANACFKCGPEIWLEDRNRTVLQKESEQVIQGVAHALTSGKIVAIKGLSGFHLACDARNHSAIAHLRQAKQRATKPFALMSKNLTQIESYAEVSPQERELLQSKQAPIVILRCKTKHHLATNIAEGQNSLGVMLPYTPIHHLIMQLIDFPIVLTSGNQSDSPQYIDNAVAYRELQHIADLFLMHNRQIVNRLDDSLVRVINGHARLLRRARGYAPANIPLHNDFIDCDNTLAVGAELKSTFCLLKKGQAVVSQHIGDLSNQIVFEEYRHSLERYQHLYDFTPQLIAADFHPDFISTQYAQTLATHFNGSFHQVQHHHAHVAAVMAENGLGYQDKVIGLALDGLGMSEEGQLWGGEVLLTSYSDCHRLASITPSTLIGGNQAMRQPWRNLYSHLHQDWISISKKYAHLPLFSKLNKKPLANINKLIVQQINSPYASSMGRVFDAVAAALGLCFEQQSYEGEAATQLEVLATKAFSQQVDNGYLLEINWHSDELPKIEWREMWLQILTDLDSNQPPAVIAARFHHGLIQVLCKIVLHFSEQYPTLAIVLCGGVFQNKLLNEGVTKILEQQQIVLSSHLLPCNDAAISLGQAVCAAAQNSK